MTQLDFFAAPPAPAPVRSPAPAPRAARAPRGRKAAPWQAPPPPTGPERASDADEFEARLVKAITLRPYQREGARWLSERRGALLADEPGVGKTPTVMAAIPPRAPTIVVCPAVARDGVWPRHVVWRPDLEPVVVRNKRAWTWPAPGQVVVLNYDVLPDFLETTGWESQTPEGLVVVLDEAHLCKTPSTIRTRRASAMCAAARAARGHSWLVTGTPLKNKPVDLWCLLGVAGLQDATWRTLKRFRRAFGFSEKTWDYTDPIEAGVPDVLRRVMLRREFADVVRDMPERQWEQVEVDISAEAAASCTRAAEALAAAGIDLETATAETLRDMKRHGAAVSELMRARALLAAAKVPALLELIDAHEEESERPLLVFSAHKAPAEAVSRRPGWAKITGDESPPERARLEALFQAGGLRGLGITIKAGGTAITLTRARRSIFVDREWTPGDNEQAEGRTYRADALTRASQEPVTYTDLVADHPIDRRLAQLLQGKRDVTAASVGAASVGAASVGVGVASRMPAPARVDDPAARVGDAGHHVDVGARDGDHAAPAPRGPQQDAPPGNPATRVNATRGEAAHGRRLARTPVEFWAEDALVALLRRGSVSPFDAPLLAALVSDMGQGLTDARWSALIKVCRRYVRLVGAPPA